MIVTSYKAKKNDDENVAFPNLQCWNPQTEVATVAAQYRGRRVSCRVKIIDLKKKFRFFPDQPMQVVTKYRMEIEAAARKLIAKNEFQDDGSILIKYQDL